MSNFNLENFVQSELSNEDLYIKKYNPKKISIYLKNLLNEKYLRVFLDA
jgi:hypothetical protein